MKLYYRGHWAHRIQARDQAALDGHEAVAASPNTGVNTLTGEGVAEALQGASVVVDVSNSPSFEDTAVMAFFTTSTRNLLNYAAAAGVRHCRAVRGGNASGWRRAAISAQRSHRSS